MLCEVSRSYFLWRRSRASTKDKALNIIAFVTTELILPRVLSTGVIKNYSYEEKCKEFHNIFGLYREVCLVTKTTVVLV